MKKAVRSYSVSIRLTLAELEALDAEAAAQGTSVSEIIRQRLNIIERVERALHDIRREVAAGLVQLGQSRPAGEAMTLETLLLLRDIAGPARQRAVAAELDRLGHKTWSPPPEFNAPGSVR